MEWGVHAHPGRATVHYDGLSVLQEVHVHMYIFLFFFSLSALNMTLIEGVGDEVTIFLGLILLAVVVVLAWISTSVPDLGSIRVIILDHTNFHRLGEIARRYLIN